MLPFNPPCAALLTFVQDRAEQNKCEPEKEEERCDDIREDPNIWILDGGEQIDREEENKSEQCRSGQQHAGPAKPVLEVAPKGPRLNRLWSIRHCGNYFQAA